MDRDGRVSETMQPHDPRLISQAGIKLAVFDIDKTFVRGDSFKWFCWFAMKRNGLKTRWFWRFASDALRHPTRLLDAGHLKKACLRICLVGGDKAGITTLVETFVDGILLKRVISVAEERLRWHKQQDHRIVFLSASPDLYLKYLGARFTVDSLVCTQFLSRDGLFTGELFSPNCKGDEKRRRLLETYPGSEIAWDQSYGYGNSVEDVSFLELLGNPVAVNPDAKLREIAVQRNWSIEAWT